MIFDLEYLYHHNVEFLMIFGDNYAGKSYCLNKITKTIEYNDCDDMFEDGTIDYELKTFKIYERNISVIDTPGLNSILQYKGFSSLKSIWNDIKNKNGLILLCLDCKLSRFSNTINKFNQIIEFFSVKSETNLNVNLLFNKFDSNNIFKTKFKAQKKMKLSGFNCFCDTNSSEIKYEGEPSIIKVLPGFKYFPNGLFLKDFKIPIGDTTIVKKSFDGDLGKTVLKIIWQIQQEMEIPTSCIRYNKKLADQIFLYNFGKDINEEKLRKDIIKEIDKSLIFDGE